MRLGIAADRHGRAVDPNIASQVIMASLYLAFGLQQWAERLPRQQAIELYASTPMHGIPSPTTGAVLR